MILFFEISNINQRNSRSWTSEKPFNDEGPYNFSEKINFKTQVLTYLNIAYLSIAYPFNRRNLIILVYQVRDSIVGNNMIAYLK